MGIKVPGWVCVPHNADADHDWEIQCDDYGDPGVVNGTAQDYYWQCVQCGLVDQYREVTCNDLSADEEFYDNY